MLEKKLTITEVLNQDDLELLIDGDLVKLSLRYRREDEQEYIGTYLKSDSKKISFLIPRGSEHLRYLSIFSVRKSQICYDNRTMFFDGDSIGIKSINQKDDKYIKLNEKLLKIGL